MMKKNVNIKHEDELKKLQQELQEWKAKYLRALADYQNLEKRISQNWEEQTKYAAEKIIYDLLSVYDTLEKAKVHLQDKGLSLGVGSFWAVLENNGLAKIEVLGKKFDPNFMECVEVVASDKEGEVVEEVRAGYTLWGKVIRVAQVKVGKKTDNKEQITDNKNTG
jgi:molecular chaperone GrpE